MNWTSLTGALAIRANASIVESNSALVLLDAGSLRPDKKAEWIDSIARQPDAVWISHAHLDHCGALPLLFERWPQLVAYATGRTKKLLPHLLMSAGIEEDRADSIASLLRTCDPGDTFSVADELTARVHEAGHLPGAGMLELTNDSSLLYTSDFCTRPLHFAPAADLSSLDAPDLLVMEGVLSAVPIDDIQKEKDRLKQFVEAGPTLVVASPWADAWELLLDGTLSEESPSFLDTYQSSRNVLQEYADELDVPWVGLSSVVGVLESGTSVVVPGTRLDKDTPGGIVSRRILENPAARIALINAVGRTSFANRLLQAPRRSKVREGRTEFRVRARVERFSIPTHPTRRELVAAVEAINPRRIALFHGVEDGLYSLRRAILRSSWEGDIVVARDGQPVEVFNESL